MSELEELRVKLDDIDDEIVKLYESRMEVCRKIGRYKALSGKSILDMKREDEKLRYAESKVNDPKNKEGIRLLFELLMGLSRQFQKNVIKEFEADRQKNT